MLVILNHVKTVANVRMEHFFTTALAIMDIMEPIVKMVSTLRLKI